MRAQAPNLVQLEGWSHRFRDIDRYLRTKGYGEEAINYFKACVCYLLNSPSKQSMHDRFRKEFEYVWPKDFVLYYRQRLLPRYVLKSNYPNSRGFFCKRLNSLKSTIIGIFAV